MKAQVTDVDQHPIIEKCFDILIEKMKKQVEDPKNQSFGNLEHHMQMAINAKNNREYLSPLYFVNLPRWMGEYGNTPLEDEILAIAHQIDREVIELAGGLEHVNKKREENNLSVLK